MKPYGIHKAYKFCDCSYCFGIKRLPYKKRARVQGKKEIKEQLTTLIDDTFHVKRIKSS